MRLILDRIERKQNGKRVAIFECVDIFYNIDEDNMPVGFMDKLSGGMILNADIEANTMKNPTILENETKQEQDNIKKRLNNLFNRNKK